MALIQQWEEKFHPYHLVEANFRSHTPVSANCFLKAEIQSNSYFFPILGLVKGCTAYGTFDVFW